MSKFFNKQEICAYLARKLIPCEPEFQIRKLYDKSKEHLYNLHLLGGYNFFLRASTNGLEEIFKNKKSIYVNPDTLEYIIYLESGEKKEGKLPPEKKFLELKSRKHSYEQVDILLDILEITTAFEHTPIVFDYPVEIHDYTPEYQDTLSMTYYNPGDTKFLTSEDEALIIEYCNTRYNISECDDLNAINLVEEWVIYLDKKTGKYKVRGIDGEIYEKTLPDRIIYNDIEEEKKQIYIDILISISGACPLYFDYFNHRYINHVAANNPDEFKKILYILNSYGERLEFKLIRVLAESNHSIYQQQIIKYQQLFDGELEAFIMDGKIIQLTDNIYRLPNRFNSYESFADTEEKIINFNMKFIKNFSNNFALYWAKINNFPLSSLLIYRYYTSIKETIWEALYRDELKLHHRATWAITDYNDFMIWSDHLLFWHEIASVLNKSGIRTPKTEDLFANLNNDKSIAIDGKAGETINPTSKKAKWHIGAIWLAAKILKTEYKNLKLPTQNILASKIFNLLTADMSFKFGTFSNSDDERNVIYITKEGSFTIVYYDNSTEDGSLPPKFENFTKPPTNYYSEDILKDKNFQTDVLGYLYENDIVSKADRPKDIATLKNHLLWEDILPFIDDLPEYKSIRKEIQQKISQYKERQEKRKKSLKPKKSPLKKS